MHKPQTHYNHTFYRVLVIVFGICILCIKIASSYPLWIETNYSTGIYPYIARTFRIMFGWLPFSLGDLLYSAAGVFLLVNLFRLVKAIIKRKVNREIFARGILKLAFLFALVYISFNLFWGLNYNRMGIAYQLKIKPGEHTQNDLKNITTLLIKKVNESRHQLDSLVVYPSWKQMFISSQAAYEQAEKDHPYLNYHSRSVKRSLYGRAGNYFGFLGYYNPFTGESQLNLTQPRFLIPYVTCHEIAHQLGYASESEANFVGYLAAVHSTDPLFRYSAYFDLYRYANRELFVRDSATAKSNYQLLDTLVKKDLIELRNFYKKYKNPFEPIVHMFYDKYLKANQQDKGIESYNYVVGLLIAYQKKYGKI